MLTLEMIKRRWPHGSQHVPGLVEGIVAAAPTVFPKYGVDTALAVAHFMGQASEECGQGLEMWESGNYTAARLLAVFPKHFTPAMARRAAHNPHLVFDIAYGGRMGNRPPPSEDGYERRGRGLSQVTGVEGYEKLQAFLREHGSEIDVMGHPDVVCDPRFTLECGVADWVVCGCLPFAKADDTLRETEYLNGGTNGLGERERQIGLWKRELLGTTAAPAAPARAEPAKPAPAAKPFTPFPGANAP